jgi:hypothetical protein
MRLRWPGMTPRLTRMSVRRVIERDETRLDCMRYGGSSRMHGKIRPGIYAECPILMTGLARSPTRLTQLSSATLMCATNYCRTGSQMNYAEVAMELRLTEREEELLRELLQDSNPPAQRAIPRAQFRPQPSAVTGRSHLPRSAPPL